MYLSIAGKLVTVPSPPITGDDPLYAVPSKVMERLKVSLNNTQPSTYISLIMASIHFWNCPTLVLTAVNLFKRARVKTLTTVALA